MESSDGACDHRLSLLGVARISPFLCTALECLCHFAVKPTWRTALSRECTTRVTSTASGHPSRQLECSLPPTCILRCARSANDPTVSLRVDRPAITFANSLTSYCCTRKSLLSAAQQQCVCISARRLDSDLLFERTAGGDHASWLALSQFLDKSVCAC